MLKNIAILALSVVLSFGVGVASVKHCPFVKKAVGDNVNCTCVDKCGCCDGCANAKGCCALPK